MKRAAALTAVLLIALSIVVKPIKAHALGGEIVAGAITAGSVWGAVAGGVGIGLAVGADAIADGLSNGTIDNRVEQWLWNKASEWEYGYTQAQVDGKVFKAELTYGDLKALSALLSEAYPEGQIITDRGHIVTAGNSADFPVPLPIETDIYFTDANQTGDTATSKSLYIYTDGADLRYKRSTFELPSGNLIDFVDNKLLGNANSDGYAYTISLEANSAVHTHLILTYSDGSTREDDFYTNLGLLSTSTLITYSLPTYVPGVGLAGASSADISDLIDALEDVPFGMSDDDVAISIPVTGDDDDVTDRPGVVPDNDELIDDAPAAVIEGEFSGFTLPNGLMYVFPFSLPYDFYRGIKLFSASPEVPEFTFNFIIPYPKGMGNGNLVDKEITLNFKQFEKLAIITRWISTFGFTMLLIKLSAFILKGGNS